jgi:hypothetical protein
MKKKKTQEGLWKRLLVVHLFPPLYPLPLRRAVSAFEQKILCPKLRVGKRAQQHLSTFPPLKK